MMTELQEFINKFNIVENALDMRDLRRWNGRSLRKEENLSEHTHLVIACLIELYDKFKQQVHLRFEDCVKLAMLHDSLEILRGDILSVTKDAIPGLRDFVDNEENDFLSKILNLQEYYEIDKDLVKLADVMACFKFIERELNYPSNNFSYEAYNNTKKVFDNQYSSFCKKYGINFEEISNVINVKMLKGYRDDAGTDIVLDKDVIFLPHTTSSIDLNVTVTPKKGEMAVLCSRTSAAIKGINVAMCPIDANYTGNISAIVHNISNNIVTYKAGESFCQWVGIKLAEINNHSNNIFIKKQGKRTNGKFGSTGV